MTTFHIQTFGCKSNQYESQAIREALIAAGFQEADKAVADYCVVNTCGVTGRAGASCRNAVRATLRANPRAVAVITGCGVDLGDAFPDLPGGPPLLVPNAKKHALPGLLRDLEAGGGPPVLAAVPDDRFALGISRFHGYTRAFIKIQDGCDNFCSYCAVPYARGRPESRPLRDIVREARRLTANGHAELVLTGINIGAYGYEGKGLGDVVAALADTPGLIRLRLGSVEPPQVTRELVAAMAASPAVCPHVHLPLQAGDDGVLASMGRRYTTAEFMDKVRMLRDGLDTPAITTDVIVGYPGESAAAARAGLEFCRRAGFSRLHVFLFSARPGTRAASLPRTETDREIGRRKDDLLRLGGELAGAYAAGLVGMRERVIVERNGGGLCDRYVRAKFPRALAEGGVHEVEIIAHAGGDVLARSVALPDESARA